MVDGYITGGTVFADANRNSVLDDGESSSTTDSSGNFEILGGSGPYILIGGTDISTGLAFKGIFEAPPRAKVINPLTTLLSGVAGLNATDAEIATAQTLVKSVLKLDSGIDLLSYDPIIEATTSGRSAAEIAIAVSTQGEAAKIANLMIQGTSVLAGAATSTINTGDAGRAILAALSDTVKALPVGTTIDLASPTTIEAVLRNAAGRLPGIDTSRGASVRHLAERCRHRPHHGPPDRNQRPAGSDGTGRCGARRPWRWRVHPDRQIQRHQQHAGVDDLQRHQGATSASLRVQVDFTDTSLTAIDQTLSMVLVNPPVLTTPDATAVTITAGQSSVISGISVTDFDDANLTVTVTPSGGAVAMTPVGSATVTTGTDGRLTVSGTKADINATLAGLTFTATTGVNAGSLTLTASDADPVSPDITATLPITIVSPSQVTLPTTGTVIAGVPMELHGFSVTDFDSASVTATLAPTGGTLAVTASGSATIVVGTDGTLTVTGSPADVTATLENIKFTMTAGATAPSLAVTVSDGDSRTVDPSTVINLTVSTVQAPRAGGDTTVTATDNTTLFIPEDSTAPTGANIRLSPSILPNNDGYVPNAIRILSFSGGTLTCADGTVIDMGASGTVLTLTDGMLDLRFTPDANRDTAATFRYVMVDTVHSTPNSAASTATISITPVNDTPTSAADTGTWRGRRTVGYGILRAAANDRDVDAGDSLSVSAVNGAAPSVRPSPCSPARG